jgi:AcrR family transcriptional regulator
MAAATALRTSHPQASLRWVRPPQQERTRASLTRLLDAAETLLEHKSFDDVSIAEVTREARTSIGGFYRRFHDKDGLLHALHERFCEDARATTDDALDAEKWAGASLMDILEQVTAFLVDIHREKRGLFRAFLLRGLSDTVVRERTDEVFRYIGDQLRGLLREHHAEISHPDPDTAAAFGLRVVLATLDHWVQLDPKTPEFTPPKLTDELTRVFATYLGVRTA